MSNLYNYQQPPPMTAGPSVFAGQYSSAAQLQAQAQPHQPEHYQQQFQGYQVSAAQPSVSQPAVPHQRNCGSCPFANSKFLERVHGVDGAKLKVKFVIFNAVAFVLAVISLIFFPRLVSFSLIFRKFSGLILAAVSMKKDCELLYGAYIGFQALSTLFTITMGFRNSFIFIVCTGIFILEILSLFCAVVLGKTVAWRRAPSAECALPVNNNTQDRSDDEDVFDNAPSQPAYAPQPTTQTYQQAPAPQMYPAHPADFQSGYNPQYQPQYPQFPQNTQNTQNQDEQLFLKYHVPLGLLSEMNFELNHQQKIRNAKLLEKHNGNIQAVVSDILSEGN